MEYAVRIKNLSKQYPDFSLNNISLDIPKGSIMGLIGENGSGKSTTIKAMLDIVKRDTGEVEILGMDIREREQKSCFFLSIASPESVWFNILGNGLSLFAF